VNARIKKRDADTKARLEGLASDIVEKAMAMKEPRFEVPTRTKSNTIWDKKDRILRMGDGVAERELFNVNQAKQFMQTMLHAKGIRDLIQQGKTSSLRSHSWNSYSSSYVKSHET
jgi:DNA topoisomerase-6 subunit A